tara:strand:+ start:65304 stop:66182 length:879 start_codon:yes stop_codon:yes gene_type:complete
MSILSLPPEKRTCLITGCSSGIGYSTAIELKKRGIRVLATARQAKDVEMLKSKGFEAYLLDMDDSQSIKSALEQILSLTQNQLFAVLNNAGFGQPGAIEDVSRETMRAQFETNLFGVLELTNQVLPIMRLQGYGRIVQISSFLGFVSAPFLGAYNASKHALEALTDTLRLELHYEPIDVVTIRPGAIRTRTQETAYLKLKQHIHRDKSHYKKIYALMERKFLLGKMKMPLAQEPEAVSEKIWHALSAKAPKTKYTITHLTLLLAIAKRVLPSAVLDSILMLAIKNQFKNNLK